MRILVFGCDGQVGRSLQASVPGRVAAVFINRGHSDITEPNDVRALVRKERPELIVNCAAYTDVDKAESEAELAYQVNRDGARHLAEAARAGSARLVHLSTDYVFDGGLSEPYPPDAPTNPLSVYGESKRDGEVAVAEALPDRSVILRTSRVYSPHGRNFVTTMLGLMREKESLGIVDDQVGSPTSAASVARVIWRMAELAVTDGIYHWADMGRLTWYEFAVAIQEEGLAFGLLDRAIGLRPITTAEYAAPAVRPKYSVLDVGSACERLGIRPTPWREALRQVLEEIDH